MKSRGAGVDSDCVLQANVTAEFAFEFFRLNSGSEPSGTQDLNDCLNLRFSKVRLEKGDLHLNRATIEATVGRLVLK
jgi:hypothetical protein